LDFTGTKKFNVTSIASPFSIRSDCHTFEQGRSIDEVVSLIVPNDDYKKFIHITLGGMPIDRGLWHLIKPKQDQQLLLRAIPMGGGGGKNPLSAVLSIALMVAVPYIAPALGGALGFGWSTAGGTFITSSALGMSVVKGGLMLVGRMLINAIAPPSQPKPNANGSFTADSPTLFITGATNRVSQFGVIPKVLGKSRIVPPQVKPYTETVGNDQYVRQLFIWGYGEVEIEDIKIGETLISEFDDVEIEHVYGTSSDPAITLYPNSVDENRLNISLTNALGYQTRTTSIDTDEISVDITFPRGLHNLASVNNWKPSSETVQFEVQYAPTGTTDWSSDTTSYKTISLQSINSSFAGLHPSLGISYYRKDLVVMEESSGVATIIKGVRTTTESLAVVPPFPSNKILLAELHFSGASGLVVVDKRDSNLFGVEFQTSSDFLVTNVSNVIKIASGGLLFNGIFVTASQTNALVYNVRLQVTRGQYDVRIKRITQDNTDTADIRYFDKADWTVLRSINNEPPVTKSGMAMTAVRIKATGQLNGSIDQLNAVVTSVVNDYDGTSSWVSASSSNPASLFREVLQGSANFKALDDSRVDITALEAWHDDCSANGREYNRVIDSQISVQELLHDIASAGRASPTVIDGLWSVVQDKLQTVPLQHFTPRNSYDFSAEKAYPTQPHALRVEFINRDNGWQQDEITVYDDGYDASSATEIETMSLSGITSSDQVWKDARYFMAVSRLRPEMYSFSVDVENLVCNRGDLIRFSHDIPLFGITSGRVSSTANDGTNVTTVTIDTIAVMESGKSYDIRFRLSDGSSLLKTINTVAGDNSTLTFSTPFPIADAPLAGDLFMFGVTGTESVELLIKSIKPSGDLSARLVCVDASPAVHTADTGTIPQFNSQVTVPLELTRPSPPTLLNIQSGEEALVVNPDGSYISRILVTLNNTNLRDVTPIVTVRESGTDLYYNADYTGDADLVSITGLTVGNIYDIEIRYKTSQNNMISQALLIPNHTFTGDTNPPADVSSFDIDIQGQTTNLSWSSNTEYDIDHYVLRFSNALSGATWGTSITVNDNISKTSNTVSVNSAIGTYLIKAVDFGGRESLNASSIVTNINQLDALNIVSTITESPSFSGTHSSTGSISGDLVLVNNADFDAVADVDALSSFDLLDGGIVSSGEYVFANSLDLGSVYTSKLSATITAFGQDISSLFDDYANIDNVIDIDGSSDPSLWGATLYVRFTSDDPSASPTWSGWQPLVIGDYTARAFEWKISLVSLDSNTQPHITVLTVQVDMPDRVEGQNDLLSNAGSVLTTVYPNGAYRQAPAIGIAGQDMSTGDYYTITNKTVSGFDIRFFNSAGSGIAKTFDYVVKGFGKVTS